MRPQQRLLLQLLLLNPQFRQPVPMHGTRRSRSMEATRRWPEWRAPTVDPHPRRRRVTMYRALPNTSILRNGLRSAKRQSKRTVPMISAAMQWLC
uniref:Putative secreted protein n=1 Tax=Anopheles darlingi TaxID=43151 RepID=A0A2M4D3B7_ANODA